MKWRDFGQEHTIINYKNNKLISIHVLIFLLLGSFLLITDDNLEIEERNLSNKEEISHTFKTSKESK